MHRLTAVAALFFAACLPDPNVRAELAEVRCSDEEGCWGRWEQTDAWTPVIETKYLDGDLDHSSLWDCNGSPDVDGCDVIDSVGHVMCWRDYDGWAAAVAPECSVVDWHTWHPVGVGMAAWVIDGSPWG